MSFNVTQCPACESTFNTNSRVLAAAAGKVRCGACLNVFEAIDNFLITEEADSQQSQGESVFVGNDPQEFFDPSSFLTRSALREPSENEPAVADLIDEQNLLEELERSETLSEDFFATVAEELQSKDESPDTKQEPEQEPDQEIESVVADKPQTDLHAAHPEDSAVSHSDPTHEDIDAAFEESILGSFSAQQIDPIEPLPEEAENAGAEASQTTERPLENTEQEFGMGLSASITFMHNATPEVQIGKPELLSTTEMIAEGQTDATSNEIPAEAEREYSAEKNLSITSDEPIEANTEIVDALPIQEVSEETNEPVLDESAESFAADLEIDTASEFSAAVSEEYIVAPEAPNTEIAEEPEPDSPMPAEAEDAASNQPAEAEELEPDSASEEEEEESTESIRARALETELSDEEALEAIPKENLAALGSMSSPVELLARKESRWLRSSLLFLSILLLGGLLAAQYLWQRMDLYSQLAQLRGLYEFTCEYVGCELPGYADIDAIRSENLAVRTHPSVANGLMVNTIIRNNSAFEQAFPILILSFNSADNTVIALREFSPDEYLDPALRSAQAMPASTPVQIELALMDPGPEAVNYTLAFRWP